MKLFMYFHNEKNEAYMLTLRVEVFWQFSPTYSNNYGELEAVYGVKVYYAKTQLGSIRSTGNSFRTLRPNTSWLPARITRVLAK